jgi:hypothetical protein
MVLPFFLLKLLNRLLLDHGFFKIVKTLFNLLKSLLVRDLYSASSAFKA